LPTSCSYSASPPNEIRPNESSPAPPCRESFPSIPDT
jgi:hypothetical protein